MTPDKILKILKLLQLTQSDSDGEALNAVRAANRILKGFDVTWEQFFSSQVKAQSGERRTTQSERSTQRGPSMEEMIRRAQERQAAAAQSRSL